MVTNNAGDLPLRCHHHRLLSGFVVSGWVWATLFTGVTNREPWEITYSRWTWARVSLKPRVFRRKCYIYTSTYQVPPSAYRARSSYLS